MKDLNELSRPLREAYYESVRILVQEALEIPAGPERNDWIWESVEGCEWVIYTYRNRVVMLVSEFSEEGRDEALAFNVEDGVQRVNDLESSWAYFAMCKDVERLVEAFENTQVTA